MASKKNYTEEQTNVVENLNSHLTKAGEKVANNKKIIYWSLGIIAAIAAFVLSYIFLYRNPRLNNSWDAYNKVFMMEQKGELNDSMRALEYQKVSTNFSGLPAGNMAALSAAEADYDVKKYDEAIKLLEKFDLSQPHLQAQAKALLGDCFVNKGQLDQALAAFDEAIKIADGNPELVPYYLFKKANIYNSQKQYAKSLECYEQIKAQYPSYTLSNGRTIDFYIEREKAFAGK